MDNFSTPTDTSYHPTMDELEFALQNSNAASLPDDDVDVVVGMWRYWLLEDAFTRTCQ